MLGIWIRSFIIKMMLQYVLVVLLLGAGLLSEI